MIEILEEIAREGSNAAARIAAIRQLQLMGEGRERLRMTRSTTATSSVTRARRSNPQPDPWTVDHFYLYASRLVFDDGEKHPPEDWQMAFVADLFEGRRENWLLTPEGNGKTTFTAELALYGADFTAGPWIPVGAASSKQARILHDQPRHQD
jgi:hypothetical protein